MTDASRPRRRRWFLRLGAVLALSLGVLSAMFWFDSRKEWADWYAACAEADRDDPGWRAADVFGPPGFSPAQPTLTNRVAAIAAKVSPTNWMNVIRDEDVVALCALYPPTLRGDPGPDGQPALEPTTESLAQMKETVCENMLSPSYAPRADRLRGLGAQLPAQRLAE